MFSYLCWFTESSSLRVLCFAWRRSPLMLCFVAQLKGHRRARSVSMAACVALASWSRYLTEPAQQGFTVCAMEAAACTTGAGDSLTPSWCGEPVDARGASRLLLNARSFILNLNQVATLRPVFSQASEEHSCVFSAVLLSQRKNFPSLQYFSKGFPVKLSLKEMSVEETEWI